MRRSCELVDGPVYDRLLLLSRCSRGALRTEVSMNSAYATASSTASQTESSMSARAAACSFHVADGRGEAQAHSNSRLLSRRMRRRSCRQALPGEHEWRRVSVCCSRRRSISTSLKPVSAPPTSTPKQTEDRFRHEMEPRGGGGVLTRRLRRESQPPWRKGVAKEGSSRRPAPQPAYAGGSSIRLRLRALAGLRAPGARPRRDLRQHRERLRRRARRRCA